MTEQRYQLGPGRPAKRPAILAVRELTAEEVRNTPRETGQQMKAIRDSHHMMARLFAMGFRARDVAVKTGYSITRVSIISQDPAFQELVATYRETVDESFSHEADEYFESANAVRVTSLRQIRDRLEEADENGERLPLNQLIAIHGDLADRTGYPKRKESVNFNMDFAARLDRAVKASADARTIEGVALPLLPSSGADLPRDGVEATGQSGELDTPQTGPTSRERLRA